MTTTTSKKIACYHCGEPCLTGSISFDEQAFCCHGCKTVYSILKDNDLEDYYDLEDHPGINVKSTQEFKFEFLDKPEIREKLLDFENETLQKFTLSIPAIHCSSCIWLLENLSRLSEGIYSSKVNFSHKKLSLDIDPSKISFRETVELLANLGYEPMINLQSTEKEEKIDNKDLLLKLGIAGFCFGNIMLFSFPDYLGMKLESDIKFYLSYLSFLLALPVLFYSAKDYFISAFKAMRKGVMNIDLPIALGVLSLFLRSSYEIVSAVGPGYFDSLTGLVFFLLIGKWFQSKTYQSLSFDRDYKSFFPLAVIKLENNLEFTTTVENLQVGDQIKIRNGEIIPADSILIDQDCQIDYSFVTGEASPIEVKAGEKVFAGGKILGKATTLGVCREVSHSYLTRLWNDSEISNDTKPKEQSLVDGISKYFTITIITIALLSFAFWHMHDASTAFQVFTAVLIVACPCALALSTPFTLGSTMNILGRNQFYLKRADIIERMWKISHIIFDKTGTLTNRAFTELKYKGIPLSQKEINSINRLSANSIHPYSQMIHSQLKSETDDDQEILHFSETVNKGIEGEVDGIYIRIGSREFVKSSTFNGGREETEGNIYISVNGETKGYFQIENSFREGLESLSSQLSRTFKLSILSGDSKKDASVLKNMFPAKTSILFNQKPEHKASYIHSKQAEGEKILMLGDGLNDAIALKTSDVGIAVSDDVSNFTPASAAIMDGKKLVDLDKILLFANRAKNIIIASFVISFLYNILGLSFAVSGQLTPLVAAIIMPISSISVVLFATMATKISAKTLKI